MELRGASAAMMAPPGTPGAATIIIPSISMNSRNSGNECGIPFIRQTARAQQVIFIALPDRWMVAQRGTVNPATPSLTPLAMLWRRVTGMVAADEDVPRAVK